MKLNKTKIWLLIAVSGFLLMLPPVAVAVDEPFYLTVIARIMIFAIAALSLDLILGFGGMIFNRQLRINLRSCGTDMGTLLFRLIILLNWAWWVLRIGGLVSSTSPITGQKIFRHLSL